MKKTRIKLLKELRHYILIWLSSIIGLFTVCFLYKKTLYNLIVKPVNFFLKNTNTSLFIYTSIWENFTTDITISLYFALILSFPIIRILVYKFTAKSLYQKEKYIFLTIIVISFCLSLLAICINYFILFPHAVEFFLSMQNIASPMLKISDYVATFFHLLFAVIIVFQFPIILLILVKFGFVKSTILKKNRKIAIVIIFIIAALITPPDIISQIIVAGILLIIYEITNYFLLKISK